MDLNSDFELIGMSLFKYRKKVVLDLIKKQH